jgi:thiosulfate reductase/polysulfide reductase chain A
MSNKVEIKKANCWFCFLQCPVEVHVSNGDIIRVRGDKAGGRQGFICEKNLLASLSYNNHPNRLNYPLKRVGERGAGKWERISWERAMDEIADKLSRIRDEYGAEAVSCTKGHGHVHRYWAHQRWSNLFGTPNAIDSTKNCFQPQIAAEVSVYGDTTVPCLPAPGVTKCMVIFASNPYEALPPNWQIFVKAKKQGAKTVVVDPRLTRTAELADLWLQIKPGTDGALAYAMLNVIIEEELYDKEFVGNWCLGFETVKDFVKEYTPEKVESITWVPREKIIEAARMYASNKPAIMNAGWGVTHSQLGRGRTLSVNLAKCILRSITGNLDIRGGELLHCGTRAALSQNMHWDKLFTHPLRKRDAVGAEEFPIMSVKAFKLFHEALKRVHGENGFPFETALYPNISPFFLWTSILEGRPYPIKGLLNMGMNVLVSRTNSRRIYQALRSSNLELHVTMELFMTPSAMLSDYVLPMCDWFERINFSPAAYYSSTGEQCIEPKYERRSDYYFLRELGMRLGQEGYWPETVEEACNKFLKPIGLGFKELIRRVRWEGEKTLEPPKEYKKYEKTGFGTFSGKVELVPSILSKLGYELLPSYRDLPQTPGIIGGEGEYPLVLISGGRVRTFFHSQLREQAKLRERRHDPTMQIHPDTALKLGIAGGDWVYIETPKGRIRQKAEITERIHPRVVHVEDGWWYPEQPGEEPHLFGVWESNASVLLPDEPQVCDYQGGPPMRAIQCRVSKVTQAAEDSNETQKRR